eukprot:TRINITY_DN7901_c0_g2_i3.p1 TRINITY_DN7901_c0_g2~~TRINITY_DN7901_c0_g2_i3.p1  ORF type:complete len:910 (-),score=192.99 TRINITY_DN7901_c0_g2_i3:82-2811(-)
MEGRTFDLHDRVDFLKRIELDAQRRWREEKIFESDAPIDASHPKYSAGHLFPDLESPLRLSQAVFILRAEFCTSYHRLKGKKVVLPFAYRSCASVFGALGTYAESLLENPSTRRPLSFHGQHDVKSMLDSVTDEELEAFTDPFRWILKNSEQLQRELLMLGIGIDWRRCFFTTNNPYYASFLRWHFQVLSDQKKLSFAPQLVPYSIQEGSILPYAKYGVTDIPLAKLRLLEFPGKLSLFQDKEVYLLSEVEIISHPSRDADGDIESCQISRSCSCAAYRVDGYDQIFICTPGVATNLAFQRNPEFGEIDCLMELEPQDLLGIPMKSLIGRKPIFGSIELYDRIIKLTLPESLLNVKSAQPSNYRQRKVACDMMTDEWIATGDALNLSVARRGFNPPIALLDLWTIHYDDPTWKDQVLSQLSSTQLCDRSEKLLDAVKETKSQIPSDSLGTKISQNNYIDSTSDSLLISAYATISHLLQGDPQGDTVGILKIRHEDLTKEVWDYFFLRKELPKNSPIPQSDLEKVRSEFEYWYPLDVLEASELFQSFYFPQMLYNHAAVFPNHFPKSIVYRKSTVDGSSGVDRFQKFQKFSADVFRIVFALCSAQNLEYFYNLRNERLVFELCDDIDWAKMVASSTIREGTKTEEDLWFEWRMVESIQRVEYFYERSNYREAFKMGYFGLKNARWEYRRWCGRFENMNRDLLLKFLEDQAIIVSPIIPHYSQQIFDILDKNISIQRSVWPEMTMARSVLDQHRYFENVVRRLSKKRPKDASEGTIYISTTFSFWIEKLFGWAARTQRPWNIGEIWRMYDAADNTDKTKTRKKEAIRRLKEADKRCKEFGLEFLHRWPFDEMQFLKDRQDFLMKRLSLSKVRFETSHQGDRSEPGKPSIQYHSPTQTSPKSPARDRSEPST